MLPSERIKQIRQELDAKLGHREPVCMVSMEEAILAYLDEEHKKLT